MKLRVIIVGAGKVGYKIAETLSKELYDVIVVDNDKEVIQKVNDTLDVLTIESNGLIGQPFKSIKVNEDDLVIAVTDNDEGNMLICLRAKYMGAGRTIARIRNPEYENDLALPKEELAIDFIINPEKSTAAEIVRLLTFSPAEQINEFGNGSVQMVQVDIDEESPLNNVALKDQNDFEDLLIAAIIRDGDTIIPKGDQRIKSGDTIFIIGNKKEIADYFNSIGEAPVDIRKVMILGGGTYSFYLAEYMNKMGMSTKIIEKDLQRCRELSEKIPDSLIINGDGTDLNLLKEENVAAMDAFVSLTGIDEENILVSLLAKQNGVKKGIAKVNRENYITLAKNIGVDSTITPSIITTSEILGFVRGEWVLSLSLLPGGQAEVVEYLIKPDSPAINIPLKDLDLPDSTIIATIISEGKVIIPHGGDVIKKDDKIVVISKADEVEKARQLFHGKEGKGNHGFWNSLKNARSSINN
ncbi:MAG TPA: Trk system potassium transporter TrkA [Halanaerobiales bacterium]|nr:Trk system potassium transporter TrkA [Halanaerobiales bacterium]